MGAPKPNLELTTHEKDCLRLYREHVAQYKKAPALRWLGQQLDINHSAAGYLIKRLTEKGYLAEKPVTVMRLKLTNKAKKAAL